MGHWNADKRGRAVAEITSLNHKSYLPPTSTTMYFLPLENGDTRMESDILPSIEILATGRCI
jgi:hypothetical protein